MQTMLDKVMGYVMQYGVSFAYAVLIFIVGKWLARVISKAAGVAMEKSKLNKTLASFFKNIIHYSLLIFVAIAVLNKIGIETTPFVALIGAAGLAVGLALQGSLSNFAAGVMLILFQPFKVGDEIEAGGASGSVKEIQIFSTILETSDNKIIIIPNAKVTSDKIVILRS
ncbi:MAG: mechanosensitive ion channel [Candidatus Omnitrophica bacterium]|nr:mechanosensitive ion channel [Candidatus Omnitrophota bacterium]